MIKKLAMGTLIGMMLISPVMAQRGRGSISISPTEKYLPLSYSVSPGKEIKIKMKISNPDGTSHKYDAGVFICTGNKGTNCQSYVKENGCESDAEIAEATKINGKDWESTGTVCNPGEWVTVSGGGSKSYYIKAKPDKIGTYTVHAVLYLGGTKVSEDATTFEAKGGGQITIESISQLALASSGLTMIALALTRF